MSTNKTTRKILSWDRLNKDGSLMLLDEQHKTIGRGYIEKEFICKLGNRKKYSFKAFLFDHFNQYFSGQLYSDTGEGWIKLVGTKFCEK